MWWRDKSDEPQYAKEELETLQEAIQSAHMPNYVEQTAIKELERLRKAHPSTAEYTIGLNYLDYLISLPWTIHSKENLDIKRAEAILNEAHYGLEGIKERILEYLAVRTLTTNRKVRILVADDEEITRRNLNHILKKEGYDVTVAANGEEALKFLNNTEFDVVLTDIKMGRVDGVEVLEKVKIRNPETQVVIITGYATVDSAVETMKKGAYYYLSKPFKLDDIRELIKKIMDQERRQPRCQGPILCFVGPPGTGKTTLARSIALALERKFVRVSLAGMKDEAEIRGHRRTYAGAMPGRIIQEIRRVGINNPVFLLDETDKAIQGFKGDPTAALLEVLDAEQNRSFTDYYLDVPFDLSNVLFIATANIVDPIPAALLDRMEVLYFNGFTDREKVQVAMKHIIPRQINENGLLECPPRFTEEAVLKIIREYTREAGLRNLEREMARLCRKLAREVLANGPGKNGLLIKPEMVEQYLGPRRYYHEMAEAVDRIGVVTGVFWTENGGEIAFVETTIMRGKSNLILTGSLGEIMQESAQAALSYLRANAREFKLSDDFFNGKDIHIHVPTGAVPKDGPSAGLTIAAALLSLLRGQPARRDLALTGELTLSGRLLPVGGVREKILAARRAGVKTVLLPEKNRVDFRNLPEEAREGLEVIFVNSLVEAVDHILCPASPSEPE